MSKKLESAMASVLDAATEIGNTTITRADAKAINWKGLGAFLLQAFIAIAPSLLPLLLEKDEQPDAQ